MCLNSLPRLVTARLSSHRAGESGLGPQIWHDPNFAESDRRFFRAAGRGDEIDYGLAEIRIFNETGREFLIESFVLDGWGRPYSHEPPSNRTLSPAGEPGSARLEERYLDRLVGSGRLVLGDDPMGPSRLVISQVDRRRPISCRVDLRIQEDGETVPECQPVRRIRTSFR